MAEDQEDIQEVIMAGKLEQEALEAIDTEFTPLDTVHPDFADLREMVCVIYPNTAMREFNLTIPFQIPIDAVGFNSYRNDRLMQGDADAYPIVHTVNGLVLMHFVKEVSVSKGSIRVEILDGFLKHWDKITDIMQNLIGTTMFAGAHYDFEIRDDRHKYSRSRDDY